jgi:hypothetical protein
MKKQKQDGLWEGLGPLSQVPYLHNDCECSTCQAKFSLGSGAGCQCRFKGKFAATRFTLNGHHFPSLKEGRRYSKLAFLENRGVIKDLELQPNWDLVVNGKRVGGYKADFRFKYGCRLVVEDTKGARTEAFNLRLKLMAALFPEVNVLLI